MSRNSLDISKALIQLGMSEFDPFLVSQPVLQLAAAYNLRLTGPEIRAFRAFILVSWLPISQSQGRNGGKSPVLSRKTPVLQRLLAETGSITTAARPWHSVSAQAPGLDGTESGIFRSDCRTTMAICPGRFCGLEWTKLRICRLHCRARKAGDFAH
jgi:hypothetical protein